MPPIDVGAKVDGKPTVVVDVGATAADEVSRWARDSTPSNI
jgi:hypothetical protein